MTEWRTCRRFPDYEVSFYAQVRRRIAGYHTKAGKVMSQYPGHRGYMRVSLTQDGRRYTVLVHQLVCEAWHGPPPSPKHEVGHRDGTTNNNRADNIRWVTKPENRADSREHGTWLMGERSPNAKLSDADAAAIRADARTQRAIAAEYGVSQSQIYRLKNGKTYAGSQVEIRA